MDLDLSHIRERFLSHLPDKPKILDAGCGPGRDLIAFSNIDCLVIGIDASLEMVKRANSNIGREVAYNISFEEVCWSNFFDGVWACSSLLHLSKEELPFVFKRLGSTLVEGGIFYASFKWGEGEREENGRSFTDLTYDSFSQLHKKIEGLELIEMWQTTRDTDGQLFLNVLLKNNAMLDSPTK